MKIEKFDDSVNSRLFQSSVISQRSTGINFFNPIRDRFLLFCLMLAANLLPVGVMAAPMARNEPEMEFWTRSQALIEEQLEVLSLLEAATIPSPPSPDGSIVSNPQSERQNFARERLRQHLLKLERYLRDRAIMPEFLCRDGITLPPDFSPAQQQTYCSLFYSQQQLQPFLPFLDRRTPFLSPLELTELPPPPPANGEDLNGSALAASISLAEMAPEPIVVSQPAKTPIATRNPSPPMALIPNSEAIHAIETSRRLMLAARDALPINNAVEQRARSGGLNYARLYPQEAQRYADLLEGSNVGITTIFPESPSPLDLNQLRDRLYPELLLSRAVVPLRTLAYGFLPRLALKVEGEQIAIASDSLTYGFIVDLGEGIDFEDFPDYDDGKIDWYDGDFSNLTDSQRWLFVNYRPPEELREIEADQRRFEFDKLGLEIAPKVRPPAVAYTSVNLDRTYLLRLIQYQLPDAILNNEPIARSRRRHAGRILQTPSSDLAIAFRPLRRNPDGSYVILWKVFKGYPNPKIRDLERYVNFQ